MLEAYVKDRRPIPAPSTGPAKYWVRVPAVVEAKVRLYEAMRAGKVNESELARRMDTHPPQIDRLLEMKHGSQLAQIESAFAALGKRLVVSIEDIGARASVGLRAKRSASRPAARATRRKVAHR